MVKILKNAVICSDVAQMPIFIDGMEPAAIGPSNDGFVSIDQKTLSDEAYKKGYAQGKIDGETLVEQHISELKEQLELMLSGLPKTIETNLYALQQDVADIVLHIVQQFFIEKELTPPALEQQINQILKQLQHQQTIELYLHPKEIALLQSGTVRLQTHQMVGLKIKPDENLALGGYVIKTSHGIFDATIEKQIDRLKEFLLELRYRRTNETLD